MSGIIIGGELPNDVGTDTFGGAVTQDGAVIYLYPPEKHVAQVVRPYSYAFNENLVDAMTSADPYGQVVNLNTANEDVRRAVVPSAEGEVLDTRNLDEYWSFMLIINHKEAAPSALRGGGPNKRSVMVGYFINCEPVHPQSLGSTKPILNPNAVMIFTHVDMASVTSEFGSRGARDMITLHGSSDLVHSSMNMNYVPEMAMCDYASITHANTHQNDQFIRSGQGITLSELTGGASHIPETLKSPAEHLKGITEAVRRADANIGDASIVSDIGGDLSMGTDMFDSASNIMMGSMQKRSLNLSLAQIVDPTKPTEFNEILMLYPNIDVFPVYPENRPTFNVSDPMSMTCENIMASMVANSVASYCKTSLISGIAFRYNSEASSMNSMNPGRWDVKHLSGMVRGQNPKATYTSQLNQFKLLVENGLFPILKTHVGPFDLMVSYNGAGETHVCLNALDNGRMRNEFTISYNKLGGWINPTLGTFNTLHNNQNATVGLVNKAISEIVGHAYGGANADDISAYGFPSDPPTMSSGDTIIG